MDYESKLNRMDEHLKRNPHDYQTVIARIKLNSDYIDHQRKRNLNERLKKVAYYRRLYEERNE